MTFKNRGYQGFTCAKHNRKYAFMCIKCLIEDGEKDGKK